MVDIHSHILPGVDDGAEDMSEALEMARMAVRCGVTDLAATPHFRGDSFDPERLALVHRRFRRLKNALEQEKIPLKLHLGAEVLCSERTVELAWAERLPTMGDSRYVLCEFYANTSGFRMDEILSGITEAGYHPVVAHPERYEAVQKDPRWALRWFQRGYVIQLDKGSVLGSFGAAPRDAARWLLDRGLVHILSGDAHSAIRRTTDLSALEEWLLERYPREYVSVLLEENPGRLLRGREMAPVR